MNVCPEADHAVAIVEAEGWPWPGRPRGRPGFSSSWIRGRVLPVDCQYPPGIMRGMPRLTSTYDWPKVVFQLRSRRNESQAVFAEAVGCSESTVSKWEQGRAQPQPRHRKKLEEIGEESGHPMVRWPLKSSQEPLFPRGQAS